MKPERRRPQSGKAQKINTENWAMPLARATLGSLKLGFCFAKNQALRIPIAIYLFELFLVRCFVISFFIWIIWARPFGSGFFGFRCATEHPADGSPSGPANPSRVFHKIVTS